MKPILENRDLRVLLAEDGSENAQAAVSLLCELPLGSGSEILALGVLTPLNASNHSFLEASLKATQTHLQTQLLTARAEMVLGYPAERIIATADEFRPDLIVMGAQGQRATLGILLGGVAQQVVEYAGWTTLVVRADYTHLRRVLLVLDGSEHSHKTLRFLAGGEETAPFPLPAGVAVHVLHVLPPAPSPEFVLQQLERESLSGMETNPGSADPDASRWVEEECQGEALLFQAAEALKTAGYRVCTAMPRGDAATEILEYVKVNGIDLIVAGSRGMSPMKAWVLGSVSRKLVHYAPCSVLIVRGGRMA